MLDEDGAWECPGDELVDLPVAAEHRARPLFVEVVGGGGRPTGAYGIAEVVGDLQCEDIVGGSVGPAPCGERRGSRERPRAVRLDRAQPARAPGIEAVAHCSSVQRVGQ